MHGMAAARRTQPPSFTPDHVFDALVAAGESMLPHIDRMKEAHKSNKEDALFVVDWDKCVDRPALFEHRDVVKQVLLHNSSGICNELVVRKGFAKWDRLNAGSLLAKVPGKLDTTSMALIFLVQMVSQVRKHDFWIENTGMASMSDVVAGCT